MREYLREAPINLMRINSSRKLLDNRETKDTGQYHKRLVRAGTVEKGHEGSRDDRGWMGLFLSENTAP